MHRTVILQMHSSDASPLRSTCSWVSLDVLLVMYQTANCENSCLQPRRRSSSVHLQCRGIPALHSRHWHVVRYRCYLGLQLHPVSHMVRYTRFSSPHIVQSLTDAKATPRTRFHDHWCFQLVRCLEPLWMGLLLLPATRDEEPHVGGVGCRVQCRQSGTLQVLLREGALVHFEVCHEEGCCADGTAVSGV